MINSDWINNLNYRVEITLSNFEKYMRLPPQAIKTLKIKKLGRTCQCLLFHDGQTDVQRHQNTLVKHS